MACGQYDRLRTVVMWIQEDALARGALSHVEEKVRMCKTVCAYAHMREVVHICTENRY